MLIHVQLQLLAAQAETKTSYSLFNKGLPVVERLPLFSVIIYIVMALQN